MDNREDALVIISKQYESLFGVLVPEEVFSRAGVFSRNEALAADMERAIPGHRPIESWTPYTRRMGWVWRDGF
jgi:hypothetical protein